MFFTVSASIVEVGVKFVRRKIHCVKVPHEKIKNHGCPSSRVFR